MVYSSVSALIGNPSQASYAAANAYLDGLIALQIHGNCKAEISYRNLAIEELP